MTAKDKHVIFLADLRIKLRDLELYDAVLAVCKKHHTTFEDAFGKRRLKSHVAARHESWHLVKTKTKWSYPEIGKLFGVDHTTLIPAMRKFAA